MLGPHAFPTARILPGEVLSLLRAVQDGEIVFPPLLLDDLWREAVSLGLLRICRYPEEYAVITHMGRTLLSEAGRTGPLPAAQPCSKGPRQIVERIGVQPGETPHIQRGR